MNIIQYIEKFGNVSFKERPFNDVDLAVLTTLSYAKFEAVIPNIVERKEGILISDFKNSDINKLAEVNTFNKLIVDLMVVLRTSSRYKHILVENSMSVTDDEALEQFSAITYIVPTIGLVISFRGTDGSTIGWKENFSVLYNKATLSQIDAIEYLNQVNAIHPDKNYILTGHSKGGNLSLYALFFGSEEIKNKISHVYAFDGYGFKDKAYKDREDFNILVNKLTQITPEESIIGALFYTPEKYHVIKANGKGIAQHHPMNWYINDDGLFETVDRPSRKSRFFNRLIKKWSCSSSKYSFQVFSDIIVEALENDKGEFEIVKDGNNPVKRTIKTARKKTAKEKISFFFLIMKLGFSYIGCFFYFLFHR